MRYALLLLPNSLSSIYFVLTSYCFLQTTQDYELINYSEHGTVVDGVLYSLDFSDKSQDSNPPSLNSYCNMSETNTPLHKHLVTNQAVNKLQSARKVLENKQEARRAMEAVIRRSAPVKDDLSLAEEMSKGEGLMTRTGLKRVTAEASGASLSSGAGLNVPPVVFSIPISKTTEAGSGLQPKKTPVYKTRGVGKGSATGELLLKNAEDLEKKLERVSAVPQPQSQASTAIEPERQLASSHTVLCDCCHRNQTNMAGNEKGWEGTATLTHGSHLRFGCLHFILSLAGHPGHSEMIQALSAVKI